MRSLVFLFVVFLVLALASSLLGSLLLEKAGMAGDWFTQILAFTAIFFTLYVILTRKMKLGGV